MNYSENIPSIDYSTTIGNFKISDLTTFFTLNNNVLELAETEVTKNSTLIELSAGLYSNPNTLWLFLFANEKINPFTLTKQDNSNLQTVYAENLSMNIVNNNANTDIFIPAGSLVYPYTTDSGNQYELGSTGEFNIDGGFALVQSYNSFTKIANTLSTYSGITFSTNDQVTILINGETGYYWYRTPDLTPSKRINFISTQADVVQTETYSDDESSFIVLEGQPVVSKGSGDYTPPGSPTSYSYSKTSNLENRNVKYYLPYSSGYFDLTMVVQNYSV